jgi:anti-sigma-K factor RskA
MDHEEQKLLLSAHALSTLDREDVRTLENHLASCAECRAELDAWRETASILVYAAQPLEPSAQVRERILASVRRESASSKAVNAAALAGVRARKSAWSLWFPQEFRAYQATAAAIIFLGLVISIVVVWRQNRAALAEVARLSTQVVDARRELDSKNQALEFFARPGIRMAELAGTKDAPSAHAMLVVDSTTGHAMLMAKGLPQAPAGKAYQLWFIAGPRPTPGKVFNPDSSGNAMLDDQLPAEVRNAAAFAVTLEPQKGVSAPTGSMYLLTPTPSPS